MIEVLAVIIGVIAVVSVVADMINTLVTSGMIPRFGALVEAFSGVLTTVLVIGYLPALYGAYELLAPRGFWGHAFGERDNVLVSGLEA